MKKFICILLCFFSFASKGQNEFNIDTLRANKDYLEKKINILNDSLKLTNDQIEKLESKSRIENFSKSSIVAKFRAGARIKKQAIAIEEPIYIFKKAKEVTVLDYYDGYFGVMMDTIYGFVSEVWAEKSSLLDQFVLAKKEKELLQMKLANQKVDSTNKVNARDRRNRLISEYGLDTYFKISNGEYWIGMSMDLAIESLGYPKSKNKSVGRWGVHEQWVYGTNKEFYLYFENGILSAYQN